MDKYRLLRRKQRASTPAEEKSSFFVDENRPITPGSRATTPHRSNASPLSPKNNRGDPFQALNTKPVPSKIRRHVLTNSEPSPLGEAPSPSVASNSARRERLARHAKLLGNRGSGRSCSTPRASTLTPQSNMAVSETPVSSSLSTEKYDGKTPASSLSKHYSFDPKSASSRKSLPPKTPSVKKTKSPSEKKETVIGSDGNVCPVDASEVSRRRVRERRAQGAKKLFILATSSSPEDGDDSNLTPLERHLSSHESRGNEDSPSVMSDVSTLTMSTLSSLARDKRTFSRNRRYSSSKLYARATGSNCSTEEKNIATPSRGRSPVRKSDMQERGTPVRSNSSASKRPATPRSTESASDSMRSSSLGRRATSIQKAKRLARHRSRSVDRRTSSSNNNKSAAVTEQTRSASTAPVPRQERFSSRGQNMPSQQSDSSSRTPMSVDSPTASSISRAKSRAASIQKARHTLARTKSQGSKAPEPALVIPKSAPPVFAAREKVMAQARSLSLAPQTRRNLDKRTARLKYHDEFALEVVKCQEERGLPPPRHVKGENLLHRNEHGVSIFIRKRPMFEYEYDAGDFDVVFTEAREGCDAVVIHSCNMHADMKKKLVKPVAFPCNGAFDEWYSNDEIYTHVGKPLVQMAATGGLATMLTYGQTGSGKTYTITGMEERVCKDIFQMIATSVQVKVQFVELAGKRCNDLLGGGDVKLVDQENGSVLLLNSTSVKTQSPEELYGAILQGKRNRATASTDKNDVSSRSHAICQITMTDVSIQTFRGVLTLIDCAGSERRNDSFYHSHDRQKESNEINSSLWALKECLRARASGGSKNGPVPYRSSSLTRILRESLERQDAHLCVIGTIAPNATDTEHSIDTLKTITHLIEEKMEEMKTREVAEPSNRVQNCPHSPKNWSHQQLLEWLRSNQFLEKRVPDHIDGKQAMKMGRIQLQHAFFTGEEANRKADRLFNALRAEKDKVSRSG